MSEPSIFTRILSGDIPGEILRETDRVFAIRDIDPQAPLHVLVIPKTEQYRDVTVVDTPFTGFQQSVAYRIRQGPEEAGEPVTRIAPRALLIPPGFPDFMSRTRVVAPGPVRLEGRAWSGRAPVTSVEVSTDSGVTWHRAELEPDHGHRWAWRRWSRMWSPVPGTHVLSARAYDELLFEPPYRVVRRRERASPCRQPDGWAPTSQCLQSNPATSTRSPWRQRSRHSSGRATPRSQAG